MMRVLAIGVALVVALGAGWAWGGSAGRTSLAHSGSLRHAAACSTGAPPCSMLAWTIAGQLIRTANGPAGAASNAISDVLDTTVKG